MIYIKFCVVFVVWSIWIKSVFELFLTANSLSKFLMISAFLAPFYSISFALFGFQFSIYKLIIPLLFVYTLVFYKSIHKNILIISTYFFIISLFSYVYALENNLFDMIIGYGREPFRAYAQPIVHYLFLILTLSAPWIIIKKNIFIDTFKVFSYYIYGCVLLVLLGWVQILFYKIGIPWFDFWFLLDAFNRAFEIDMSIKANDKGYFRMSSFGGEPRHFGSFVALSIILLLWLRKNTPNHIPYISGNFGNLILGLLISGLFASFSSSALLSLMIGILIYYTFVSRVLLFLNSFLILFLILLFSYSGFSNIGFGEVSDGPFDFLYNILWKLQSIDMMLYAAPKDAFAVKAILNDFWHFLIGYGVGMAEFYVPEFILSYDTPFGERSHYHREKPLASAVVPTSGILQVFLSGGIVGGVLLMLLLFKTCISLNKNIFGLVVTILCMVTVSSTLMFTMGAFFIALLICLGKSQQISIIRH